MLPSAAMVPDRNVSDVICPSPTARRLKMNRQPFMVADEPREKFVRIGAKVVRHGRYVIFQMAEVAVPKELFQEILRLIDGLRPRPAPA